MVNEFIQRSPPGQEAGEKLAQLNLQYRIEKLELSMKELHLRLKHYFQTRKEGAFDRTYMWRFLKHIRNNILEKKQLELVSKLYAAKTNTKKLIHQDYIFLHRQNPSVPIDLISQFIEGDRLEEYPQVLFPQPEASSVAESTSDEHNPIESVVSVLTPQNNGGDLSSTNVIQSKISKEEYFEISRNVFEKTSILQKQLAKWRELINEGRRITVNGNWLHDELIPFMKNVQILISHDVLSQDYKFNEIYYPAISTSVEIRSLFDDAAALLLQDNPSHKKNLSKQLFNGPATISKRFFELPVFLQYCIQYRHLLMTNAYLGLQRHQKNQPSVPICKVMYLIRENLEDAQLIKIYESILALRSGKTSVEISWKMLKNNLQEFQEKETVSLEDAEEFFMDNQKYWDVIVLGNQMPNPAVDYAAWVLLPSPNEIQLSSFPSIRISDGDKRVESLESH